MGTLYLEQNVRTCYLLPRITGTWQPRRLWRALTGASDSCKARKSGQMLCLGPRTSDGLAEGGESWLSTAAGRPQAARPTDDRGTQGRQEGPLAGIDQAQGIMGKARGLMGNQTR